MSSFKIKKHFNKRKETNTCVVCGSTELKCQKSICSKACTYSVCEKCIKNYDIVREEIEKCETECMDRQLTGNKTRAQIKKHLQGTL